MGWKQTTSISTLQFTNPSSTRFMANTLTLPLLIKYTKYFIALEKAGIEFTINADTQYRFDPTTGSSTITQLIPHIRGIKSLEALGQVWEAGCSSIRVSTITDFPGFSDIYKHPNAVVVTSELYKRVNPSVKFFAESAFQKIDNLDIYLINGTPIEQRIGDRTLRICCTPGEYYHSEIVYCASELNQFYNYIDKGHVIVMASSVDAPESTMFVTDVLTLDMNYVLAAFAVYPDCITGLLQNKSFLPSKDIRNFLPRIEKNIPPRLQATYQKYKADILADFTKNTHNIMVGTLARKESAYVELNNIRIYNNKAVYAAGGVSIGADNLSEVTFSSLNPDEEWDIFTLINSYTDWVEEQFKFMPLNAEGTGFKEKKTFKFKINDIPIKVECFTDNTRRAVNGHLINMDELSKVLKRAACYLDEQYDDNEDEYDKFAVRAASERL